MNQSGPNQGDRPFGMRCFAYTYSFSNRRLYERVNAELIGASYSRAAEVFWPREEARGNIMDAQRVAIDAVVALTDCDREMVATFIRRFYLAGVKDPKRLTFKGLQALARA